MALLNPKKGQSPRFTRAHTAFGVLMLAVILGCAASPLPAAPLRNGADDQGKFIGAAVDMNPFRNEAAYRTTLGREFNMLVAENAMKFDAIHPAQNSYNFTAADELVAYAEANNMQVRGHVLVWHNQNPSWLVNGNFNRDQMIAILQDHVTQVMGRYRGRIVQWDVVNEAISDNNGQPRDSIWRQRIGADYIDIAFRAARAADPMARLYYNDYEAEGSGAKSDAVFNLVSGLVSRGVPIDGVGWQWHKISGSNATVTSAHANNAARIANLGLELMITEADVRIQLPTTAAKLQQQAAEYRSLWSFCLNTAICRGVVTWGFTDKYSWVPGVFSGFGDALIMDVNYQPKPAYTAIDQLLGGGGGAQTLTVNKAGGGSGTVTSNPAGISCGTSCTTQSASFANGTNVTLTAAAASGSTFAGWSGACTGTGACTVSMTQARSVTAAFSTSGGGTTCANAITFTSNTNNFNTTGPVCYRTNATINGWGCYNFDGRTVTVGGQARACGQMPLARSPDGYYYFAATGGTFPWAGLYTW